MSRVDEDLTRSLRSLQEAVDEEVVFDRLAARRAKRLRRQRFQRGALAALVVLGTLGGVYGLWQAFRPIVTPETRRPSAPFANLDQLLYWTKGDGGWSLVRPGEGSAVASVDARPVSSALSPDGAWLAIGGGVSEGRGAVRLISLRSREVRVIGDLPTVNSVAWLSQEELWFCDGDGSIRSLGVPTAEVGLVANRVGCVELALSPDRSTVAFSTGRGDIAVAPSSHPASGEVAARDVNLGSPSWSPEGTRIAFHRFTGPGASIDVLDVATGQVSTVVPAGRALSLRPAWSPDGRTIAFVHVAEGAPAEVRLLDLESSTVKTVDPGRAEQDLPLWEATVGGSPEEGEVFFPTWRAETLNSVPQALLAGATLIRHDDCLFARTSSGEEELLVWQPGSRYEEAAGGRVVDAAGEVVATVGDPLPRMGGGNYTASFAEESFIGDVIPEPCRGPGESVWLVGEIEGQPLLDTREAGLDVGVPYRIELYTHCGIDFWTRFDGSYWDAVGYDNSSGNPPPGLGNPVDFGTMTLVSRDEAEYVSDAGKVIRFVRAAERPQGMVCY